MVPEEFSRYIKSKEFKNLLMKYEQALSVGEKTFIDSDDLLDIAEYYHMNGEVEKAVYAADYCHQIYPDNEKAFVFIARSALISGDPERAKAIAAEIETEETVDTCLLKTELYLVDDDDENAQQHLLCFYENIDEDDEDLKEDIILGSPLLYLDYGKTKLAEYWLQKAEEEQLTDDPDYVEAKARLLVDEQKFKEAIPFWNKYIDDNAFNANAWIMLAQCQYQTGSCHEALNSCQYALAIEPQNPDALLAAGNALFTLGRDDEAIQKFEEYLDVVPQDAQGELLLATAYFVKEAYDQARLHIENAIDKIRRDGDEETPDFVFREIYRQAAYICGAQKDKKQALHYIDYLLFYGMSETDIELLRASILLELGEQKEAFDIFNSLVNNNKADGDLYIQIGIMLVDACIYEMGYEMLTKVYGVMKQYGQFKSQGYDRLAYACLMTDRYPEFLAALKICTQYLPTETVTIFSVYFPDDMPVSDYYDYANKNKIQAKK